MNDGQCVREVTSSLKKIIRGKNRVFPDRVSVTFQHNDSAPSERVIAEVAGGIVGGVALTYSLNQERKKQGDGFSRGAGVLGAAAVVGAMVDYANMQENKNKIARVLAQRITKFLNKNRLNVANLILHSQGADVGYRALRILESYRDRIRVVTLGAMTTIPNKMAAIRFTF